jgi:hypothetical protein
MGETTSQQVTQKSNTRLNLLRWEVAILPVAACSLAFSYEWGYTSYFGIPKRLITLDLTTVIIILGSLVLFAFLLWTSSVLIRTFKKQSTQRNQQTQEQEKQAQYRQVLYQGGRWQLSVDDRLGLVWEGDIKAAVRALGKTTILVILFLVGGLLLAAGVGYLDASQEITFLVTNTSPEMVVLRIYGDTLICTPFDRNTKILDTSFVVLKIPEDGRGLEMHYEYIIDLRPSVNQIGRFNPFPSREEKQQRLQELLD